jgi:hypothetical protein
VSAPDPTGGSATLRAVRRACRFIALSAAALAVGGCGGGDNEDFQPAPLATPKRIRVEVYDRSYSECASYSLERLAGKYRVERNRTQVAGAVGRNWAKFFGGGPDAARSGRGGCLDGMNAN